MNFHNQDIQAVLEIQLSSEDFKQLYQLLRKEKEGQSFQWHTRQLSHDDATQLTILKHKAQKALQRWEALSMGRLYHEEEE